MDAEDQLVLEIRRIINEGAEALKSTPVKLAVRRRTITDITRAIESSGVQSMLVRTIKEALDHKSIRHNENELQVLSNKVGVINNIVCKDYNSTRLVKLQRFLTTKLCDIGGSSTLTMNGSVRMIHHHLLRIDISISEDDALTQFINDHTNGEGVIFPSVVRCKSGCKERNPIILEPFGDTIAILSRKSTFKMINDIVDIGLTESMVDEEWTIMTRLEKNLSVIRVVANIEINN